MTTSTPQKRLLFVCVENANRSQMTQAFARILRLTSLAPDVVERILNGSEPAEISLAKLRNDLPVLWAEQEWGE